MQKNLQKPVKTHGFAQKAAETCKKHMGLQKKQQKPVKTQTGVYQKNSRNLKKHIDLQKKQQKPVKPHGFAKKSAETCKNIWVCKQINRNL